VTQHGDQVGARPLDFGVSGVRGAVQFRHELPREIDVDSVPGFGVAADGLPPFCE
jgi:hypothetical protein